jgi:hypothetical protein
MSDPLDLEQLGDPDYDFGEKPQTLGEREFLITKHLMHLAQLQASTRFRRLTDLLEAQLALLVGDEYDQRYHRQGVELRRQASFDHFDEDGNAYFEYEENWQYGETYDFELEADQIADPDFETKIAAQIAQVQVDLKAKTLAAQRAEETRVAKAKLAKEERDRTEYERLRQKYESDQASGDK